MIQMKMEILKIIRFCGILLMLVFYWICENISQRKTINIGHFTIIKNGLLILRFNIKK